MKRVSVVYTLIQDPETGKILMVQNRRGSSFDYSLPGGAVEPFETLEQGAIREVEEETGYIIKPTGMLAVNEVFFPKKDEQVLFFTFKGSIIDGQKTLSRPSEILAIEWIDVDIAIQRMPYLSEKVFQLHREPAPYVYEGEK
ncbi:8-oxo-dGTP diphosphatase [Marininema mesophilum]|uniref:8-oxo-dGTP diphosphatase n=1 Tax=Marininema mesophilum TaxID=1048340 RepID=A0A1H2Z2H1_9BACL|nr:NUDIX hydrolase [Marininema mesophilum]SDX11642.1 8-oxo-dGTP diphosphatase [Marininema mesophilum]